MATKEEIRAMVEKQYADRILRVSGSSSDSHKERVKADKEANSANIDAATEAIYKNQ